MTRLEESDRGGCIDTLADTHHGAHRLVAGPKAAGVGQRHQRPPGQGAREHHRGTRRRVHGLVDRTGEIDTPVAALPIRRWGVENPHHRRVGS